MTAMTASSRSTSSVGASSLADSSVWSRRLRRRSLFRASRRVRRLWPRQRSARGTHRRPVHRANRVRARRRRRLRARPPGPRRPVLRGPASRCRPRRAHPLPSRSGVSAVLLFDFLAFVLVQFELGVEVAEVTAVVGFGRRLRFVLSHRVGVGHRLTRHRWFVHGLALFRRRGHVLTHGLSRRGFVGCGVGRCLGRLDGCVTRGRAGVWLCRLVAGRCAGRTGRGLGVGSVCGRTFFRRVGHLFVCRRLVAPESVAVASPSASSVAVSGVETSDRGRERPERNRVVGPVVW